MIDYRIGTLRTLLLLLVTLSALPAIVSIKPVDIGEKKGFSGDAMLALSSNRGNSETDVIDSGLTLQFDTNATVSFFKGSYNYGEANGEANIDKNFFHLRNIYNLGRHFDWESFVQRQSNAFQNLTSRFLLGGGTRYNGQLPWLGGKIYLGVGAFYVNEQEKAVDATTFGRVNIYLSYKLEPSKNFSFALVSYYQPRLGDGSDYLLLSNLQSELKINSKFSLTFSIGYTVDSKPASGVSPYDFTQTTALKYTF